MPPVANLVIFLGKYVSNSPLPPGPPGDEYQFDDGGYYQFSDGSVYEFDA